MAAEAEGGWVLLVDAIGLGFPWRERRLGGLWEREMGRLKLERLVKGYERVYVKDEI